MGRLPAVIGLGPPLQAENPACKGRRLHNGPDEERYVEGMVVINNGRVSVVPDHGCLLKSNHMACYAAFSIFINWDKR